MPTEGPRSAAGHAETPRTPWVSPVVTALGLIVVLVVTTYAWRVVLFAAHPIVSGDLFTPFTLEALRAQFVSFWNPVLEFPNIETIDRLAFVAPFLLLNEPATIQKAMIAVLVLGAGASMFLAARRLSAPWPLAVVAAIAFACNPWIAERLHHLYMLVGYVALPAVVALWIRPPRRGAVLWLVLLLTLASTTPHTTAALWFVVVVLLLARPTRAAQRRFAWTAGAYAAVNVWWWLPILAYLGAADLVPSWPTWEQLDLFSRNAIPAAVLRLGGSWWPFVEVETVGWRRLTGFGLAAAAAVGLLARPSRWPWTFAVLAALLGALALGTNAAIGFGWLVIEGPFADRAGWLLRDPNKMVGALATFLVLLAAGADGRAGQVRDAREAADSAPLPGQRVRQVASASQVMLLIGYLSFSIPYVTAYTKGAYEANPVPDGLRASADWLRERGDRAAWVPAYLGAQTFWNGENLAPEFLAYSTPAPVLAPYNYDERGRRAFFMLDFGAVLGDVPADTAGLMDRFGVRYLAHHRDVRPARLQPSSLSDPRVELRALRIASRGLPEAARFPSVTIYGAREAPEPRWVEPALSQRPTAAAAALSTFGPDARHVVTVATDHPGIDHAVLLPGDALVPMLAEEAVRVPLAAAAPHVRPTERWSRIPEMDLAWWPHAAMRGGPPPPDAPGVVTTTAGGARLGTRVQPPTGNYAVWTRVYRGPSGGRVRASMGGKTWTLDLRAVSPAMAWERLGSVELATGPHEVGIENIHGDNTVADLLLVSVATETRAAERAAALEPVWLWTQTAACRSADPGKPFMDVVEVEAPLAWDQPLDAGRSWRDYQLVEIELLGHGDGRIVEAWTEADGVWLQLGEIEVHRAGWQTAFVPVDRARLAAAPRGARATAMRLRLLTLPASGAEAEPEPIVVRRVALRSHAPCEWSVDIPAGGRFELHASADARPFPVAVDGRMRTVIPGRPTVVTLEKGTVTLRFPEGVPAEVQGLWLSPAGPTLAGLGALASAPAAGATGESCPATWRLLWTPDRYIERLSGRVAGERVEAVAVDGPMAGYWLPPGVCGEVRPDNPWKRLGAGSAAASLVAMLGLIALTAWRRVP